MLAECSEVCFEIGFEPIPLIEWVNEQGKQAKKFILTSIVFSTRPKLGGLRV